MNRSYIVPLSSYIFVCRAHIQEFNITQSRVIFNHISPDFIWIPNFEGTHWNKCIGVILEQDQECWNYMQINLKNKQRGFKSLASPSDSALNISENFVGDLEHESP